MPVLLHCSRKLEILPAAAGQITREDSAFESDSVPVQLRRYTFTLGKNSSTKFLCESKKYPDAAAAQAAATKSIAQRPAEELKKEGAWFARAGLSLWLKTGSHLNWCMYAGSAEQGPAIEQVREAFIRAYEAAS